MSDSRKGPGGCRGPFCSGYERDTVVVVHRAGAGSVRPVPAIVVAVFGRALKLLLGHAGTIATEVGVVFQRLPWQPVVVIANSEDAAEAEHGIRYPAAHLVDHHPLDRSDLLVVSAINGGSFPN